jgi:hypothetical protein
MFLTFDEKLMRIGDAVIYTPLVMGMCKRHSDGAYRFQCNKEYPATITDIRPGVVIISTKDEFDGMVSLAVGYAAEQGTLHTLKPDYGSVELCPSVKGMISEINFFPQDSIVRPGDTVKYSHRFEDILINGQKSSKWHSGLVLIIKGDEIIIEVTLPSGKEIKTLPLSSCDYLPDQAWLLDIAPEVLNERKVLKLKEARTKVLAQSTALLKEYDTVIEKYLA